MLKLCLFLLFFIFSAPECLAQDSAEIMAKFNKQGFVPFSRQIVTGIEIPAIFLDKLPSDLQNHNDKDKEWLFIQIMSPLAMRTNKKIMAERKEILALKNEFQKNNNLTEEEIQIIETKAKKYDIFTRFTGNQRTEYLLNNLVLRVDIVPASILVGAAIIESDWGRSRPAHVANAIFKELVWHTKDGLLPKGQKEDLEYRIKQYPTLQDAVDDYALKLNSNIDFAHLWSLRFNMHNVGSVLRGSNVTQTLDFGSKIENFIGLLNYTIVFYNLDTLDYAKLKI